MKLVIVIMLWPDWNMKMVGVMLRVAVGLREMYELFKK